MVSFKNSIPTVFSELYVPFWVVIGFKLPFKIKKKELNFKVTYKLKIINIWHIDIAGKGMGISLITFIVVTTS